MALVNTCGGSPGCTKESHYTWDCKLEQRLVNVSWSLHGRNDLERELCVYMCDVSRAPSLNHEI